MIDGVGMIATEEDWPHGLRCMDCDELLVGKAYTRRLVAFEGDAPRNEIVCVPCALTNALMRYQEYLCYQEVFRRELEEY